MDGFHITMEKLWKDVLKFPNKLKLECLKIKILHFLLKLEVKKKKSQKKKSLSLKKSKIKSKFVWIGFKLFKISYSKQIPILISEKYYQLMNYYIQNINVIFFIK